jgi:HAD superfamily hydrolase (TIGR01509 family)
VTLTAGELQMLSGTSGPQFWGYVKDAYNLPGDPEEYWASYDAAGEVDDYDQSLVATGLLSLLHALRSDGLLVGLVTSASRRRTERAIDFLEIRPLLDVHVCAEDLAEHKPDPAPYLTAARHLKAGPGSCLALEDSHRGVQSAIAAGMTVAACIHFVEESEAVSLAHGTIRDLRAESPHTLRALHERAASMRAPTATT